MYSYVRTSYIAINRPRSMVNDPISAEYKYEIWTTALHRFLLCTERMLSLLICFIFFNTLMCLGICIARCLGAHIEKKCNNSCNCQGSDVLAMPHLSLYDQICALQLLFVMHLVVMIRADKNFTDTNHLNQYPSF